MEHSAGKAPRMKQRIALLGSTGSIGVQTLDIVRENSELFEITTLTAHRNWEALARQAEEFAPDSVVIADDSKYDALRRALADRPVKVYAGADAIRQVVQADTVDTVVNALVGYAGLLPTVAAIEAGKKSRWPTRRRSSWAATTSCGWPPSDGCLSCRSTPNIQPSSNVWWAKRRPRGG